MALTQAMTKATLIEFTIIPGLVNVPRKGIDIDVAIAVDRSNAALIASQERGVQIYSAIFNVQDIEGVDAYGNMLQVIKMGSILYSHQEKTYVRITNIGNKTPAPASVTPKRVFSAENVDSPWLMIGQPDPFGVSR